MANKETIIMGCENWVKNHNGEEVTLEYSAIAELLDVLKEQKSIIDSLKSDLSETLDVVTNRGNVVRCGDCKHYHKGFNCDLLQKPILKGDDWFCADGERNE